MALQFFETSVGSPSGAAAGVFIPISDLPGINAGEFAAAESDTKKQSKAMLATYLAIADGLPDNTLGLTATRGSTGAGLDLTNNTFTMVPTLYIDHETGMFDVLPIPTAGNNLGVGGLAITDIFANAVKIAADGAISGEGFLIPTSDLGRYGAPNHGNLDPAADSRLWFLGLFQWVGVTSDLPVRGGSTESAIVGKSRAGTSAVTLPGAATATDNPTTDLVASDLSKISVVSHNCTLSVQTRTDQLNQTLDVNVTTT